MSTTWRTLLAVTAGNLFPLVLVLLGQLDLPLLLVCYWVEAIFLPGIVGWQPRVCAAVLGLILVARALEAVDWSLTSLLVVLVTLGFTLGGLWAARRDRAPSTRPLKPGTGFGSVMWRMCLLLVGAAVALSYAQDLEVLLASGWEPVPVGSFVATPFALAFNEMVFALGLEPMAAAALVFVFFKAVNEGLWTVYRSLNPATPVRRSRWRTAA